MGRLIYAISTKENPSASAVGGKAKSLIELAHAGFPVPKGIVLAPYGIAAHVNRWPTNIDSRRKILYPKCDLEKGGWKGEAISAGVVRGKAKFLQTPYEKPIAAGEILVTVATEPAWTPIFINAAGVVMEIGGTLQHGAIIAREYGIPCVSGI